MNPASRVPSTPTTIGDLEGILHNLTRHADIANLLQVEVVDAASSADAAGNCTTDARLLELLAVSVETLQRECEATLAAYYAATGKTGDAELIRLCETAERQNDAQNVATRAADELFGREGKTAEQVAAEARAETLNAEWRASFDRIVSTRATTRAGMQAKARVMSRQVWNGDMPTGPQCSALLMVSIVGDLLNGDAS